LSSAGAHLEPHDADGPPALERSNLAELQLKAAERQRFEAPCDLVHDFAPDAADETDRQVEILGRRPAKLWRSRRASGEVRPELVALGLGHRKPEERADLQRRAGFFQFAGAQLLGAVGRQP
jgi:hypothetical protein